MILGLPTLICPLVMVLMLARTRGDDIHCIAMATCSIELCHAWEAHEFALELLYVNGTASRGWCPPGNGSWLCVRTWLASAANTGTFLQTLHKS
ncbi:hypothetical protein VTI74DRAFT_2922 [Chaetomium olivicolor]